MAEVSQSKVIPIYVRKISGNNIIPDGSVRNIPPTFPTSTIVTKTGA